MTVGRIHRVSALDELTMPNGLTFTTATPAAFTGFCPPQDGTKSAHNEIPGAGRSQFPADFAEVRRSSTK